MRLRTIKSKKGDTEYNELIAKTRTLIIEALGINKLGFRYNYLFFIGWFNSATIFLYKDTVIVADIEYEITVKAEPIYKTAYLSELYTVRLLKDCPKTTNDIEFKTVINKSGVHWFNSDTFLNWIDEPSEINEQIDEPYYKIITFLRKYNKYTFSTERYSFYSKWDNDSNFITNIYAYDKKCNAELKLYIPDRCEKIAEEWQYLPPKTLNDVIVEDLSGKLSLYQQRQCKKAFLKLANEQNSYFNIKNYWVMELVKLAVQPIHILHEWSCHRVFCKPSKFSNIWVYDCPKTDEEPYFFITDSNLIQDTTKIAVLNFKNPTYHSKGIYKRENVKRKGWELNEQEIKDLIEFLQSQSDRAEENGAGKYYQGYYIKTNWQQLIFEYNHNTADWDIDEPISHKVEGEIEQLPFDLPMPDYTKLWKN